MELALGEKVDSRPGLDKRHKRGSFGQDGKGRSRTNDQWRQVELIREKQKMGTHSTA